VGRARGSIEAEAVLEKVYALPQADRRFLLSKLDDARGFAIFPEVRKSGVMAATVYGRGIMAFRDDFWEWTTPILLSLQGRSVGPQLSADRSTIIFIFDRICSVRDFLTAHHHISTTPQGTVITHIGHPEPHDPMGISVHVLQHGMSMGQSIDSYSIHIDEAGNAALYGIDFSPACLVQGVSASPKLPWMIKFFERMALPPGIPERTIDIR
jgi:lipid-binding SYLF domain-containing protein